MVPSAGSPEIRLIPDQMIHMLLGRILLEMENKFDCDDKPIKINLKTNETMRLLKRPNKDRP